MSVRTQADEKIDQAREHAHDALMALNAVVIEQCWGHDDFIPTRIQELEKAHQLAQRLRNVLR